MKLSLPMIGSISSRDFVEHCSTRWETGKSMLVCIDKITCGRMYQRIEPRWKAKIAQLSSSSHNLEVRQVANTDTDEKERAPNRSKSLKADWHGWKHDHRDHHQRSTKGDSGLPEVGQSTSYHCVVMKTGFQTGGREASEGR